MPQTVLIVDDHAGFRGLARRMLEAGGYTVVGEPVVVLTSSREAADFGRRLERTPARGFIHKDELSPAAVRNVAGAPG